MDKELTLAHTWSLLDNLQEGVILATPDGTLHYANPTAQHLLGLADPLPLLHQVSAVTDLAQRLLQPPADVHIAVDGAGLLLRARRWAEQGQELIQITLTPIPTPSSHGEVLPQLTALTQISNERDFDKKLQLIVNGLQMSGWQRVMLTLRDQDFNPTKYFTAGFPPELEVEIGAHLLPAEVWNRLFHSEAGQQFRQGLCFLVPGDAAWSHKYMGKWLSGSEEAVAEDDKAWHPRDVLVVPLLDRQQQEIGLIALDRPTSGSRPDAVALLKIELYAQFAASAIENTRLVDDALARSQELEILFEASNELANTLEKDRVLTLMGQHLMEAIQADDYTIYQWREESESLVVLEDDTAVYGTTRFPAATYPLSPDHKAIRNIIETHQPLTMLVTSRADQLLQRPGWLPENEPYATVILPIVLSEVTYGLIEIVKRNTQPPSQRETQMLMALSNQANIALETALIFAETFERERFYNALGSVSLAINYTLKLDAVLNLICSESLRIFNVDGAYIWLHEEGRFVGRAASGHAEDEFYGKIVNADEEGVFVNIIAETRQATYVNNIREADVQFKLPQRKLIQAALGVPLEQEGSIVGVLILIDRHNPRRFSDNDVALATTFGVQAAIALQNARLFAELRQLNEELDLRVAKRTQALHEESNRVKILLRITSELSASLDQDRVLHQALHLVNEVVNATQGVILLIDQVTGELVFRAAFGADKQPGPRGLPSGLMRDEGLAGWMIANRSSVIVHDTRQDPRWVDRPESRDHRSVLAVPLLTGEEVIGVLMLFHNRPNAFTMQQLDLVEAAAIQVANAINNANLYLLIRDQAERLGTTLHLEQIETAKNQAILESIADGVIVADAQNEITLANLPAGSILGIPRGDLVGKSINEFLGLYGQVEHSWLSKIKEWAQNADRIEEWTYIDEQLTIEDKVVSVHLSPVLAGKQFFGTVSIFRDITKEVELDRLKSEFVSTVSHELRTPMTSIKGYVDLMLMGAAGQMSEPQTRYLQVIKSNAERLHMLVNDLLDISRIETGKTALDLRPVDISQMVKQIVEGHLRGRIQHESKMISVYTDTPPNLPLVNIDNARITQVLTNLLDNAFNYTPENGQIKVSARENGNHVNISISDTGIGISKEDQKRIFDRFYRAENASVQKVPGTGLGLAIVRSLVEMHNGHLIVESVPDKGSTFTFNLPVVVEDSEPA